MPSNLLALLKKQPLDYNNYARGLTKVIGYLGHLHTDCTVNDILTYPQWVYTISKYPVIKVEGLEQYPKLTKQFKGAHSIHLFVSQHRGLSFKWHKDDVDVLLYVVKGRKVVQLRNRRLILNAGQSVFIPKGHLHRVISKSDTWALSIGC
jgi:mannose-6-phosphate isomerase-like protein (cupin superfamily)